MRTLTLLTALCSTAVMASPLVVVRIDMEDALQLPSGGVFPSPSGPLVIFVRAPGTWLEKGGLTAKAKAAVLSKLYGPTWEQGNEDGSRYVVKSFKARELSVAEHKGVKDGKNTWFYEVTKGGALEKRGPDFGPAK